MMPSTRASRPAPYWRHFAVSVVSPALLTFALFLGLIFGVVIPTMKANIIERKREMIRELTQAAWSDLADLHARERQGLLTRQEAQEAAVARVRNLRYGDDGKDYFWVSDMHPRMIVHPYRPELNGQDLSNYSDRAGKRPFVEFARLVREGGAGYAEYLWQWKDDQQRVVPKLSYVKGFEPWGWIIGTGVYLEDVRQQISDITRRVIWIAVGFSALVAGLLVYMTKQGLDLERGRLNAEAALRESEEKYRTLVEGTTEGIALVLQGRVVYGNATLLDLLGYDRTDLDGMAWERLFDPVPPAAGPNPPTPAGLRVQAVRKDGTRLDVMAGTSPVVIGERTGLIVSVKDMTAHQRAEDALSRLLAEAQTTQLLPTRPVSASRLLTATCALDTPIRAAAAAMTRADASALLVTGPSDEPIGIVTDEDFRARVVAAGVEPSRPVAAVMSAPLLRIPADALAFEAANLMRERGVQHVVVTDALGATLGVLTAKDLIGAQPHSVATLQAELRAATCVDELRDARSKLPFLVKSLLEGGTRIEHVTRIMTSVSDLALLRLIEMGLREVGPPPRPFAFIVLGSEARGEQTLKTDQDNAIIYGDGGTDDSGEVQAYYLRLGSYVCEGLDAIGYARCAGDVMASNAKWCKPLSEWRAHFTRCVMADDEQALHDMNVLFDFRCAHGEISFAAALREHVRNLVAAGQHAFFFHLVQTTLQFRPPIGFFGNIQLESGGAHPSAFNIKNAIIPVVNFARIYALRHHLEETNTLERLRRLLDRGVLLPSSHGELSQAFVQLMELRLAHQARRACAGGEPDNYIELAELTLIQQSLLKRVFSDIGVFQSRLRADFARTS